MPTAKTIRQTIFKARLNESNIWTYIDGVPCLDRNGYVVFTPEDSENPRNWALVRKWYITFYVSFLALVGNITSSITSGSVSEISADLHVSEEAAGLTTTLFLLGYCAGPFLFAPLSEFYGRRLLFQVTFPIYLAFTLLSAFAPNFGALLVGRFLSGTFISSALANGPAVIADLWCEVERGNAIAIFSLAVWCGPSLGPIISGFLVLGHNWRWGFYVCLMVGGIGTILLPTAPETNAAIILNRRARIVREAKIPGYEDVQAETEVANLSLMRLYKTALIRPWCLFFDLISFLCSLYLAFVFLLQYMLFSIYPIVFQDMRGWNEGVGQLPLLGTVVGSLVGMVIIFLDTRRRRTKSKVDRFPAPEDRLIMGLAGGVGFPITMFWFAWTAQYNSVPWIIPTIAGCALSISLMLTYVSYVGYIVDSYGSFAASAIAANTFARSLGSAAAPLFTNFMFDALGVGGGGSLIGGVATLLAITPFLFYYYGHIIRRKSKYATSDEGPDETLKEEPDPTAYPLEEIAEEREDVESGSG